MNPKSAKSKGRRLQNRVAEDLRRELGLAEKDVKPAIMGETGKDIHLSQAAHSRFPLALECKNVEKLNIWNALAQAEENSDGDIPVVVFTRNRHGTYAALPWEALLCLLKRLNTITDA